MIWRNITKRFAVYKKDKITFSNARTLIKYKRLGEQEGEVEIFIKRKVAVNQRLSNY
ncbi:hypothetical protein [Bacteroides gallinarum]|uniref:hypothetical protein n=1 Tax=Bacteroides gallinarum TaxID=376806 RepID=UPI0012B5B5A0|nr:hypothetical protein [Bacteroides gallinarum]